MPRARDLLGPNGPLASGFDRYEERHGQLAMTDAVEDTLARDGILVCEAGTGTGKTLAYLVPALQSGRKVIVSTATRALQDQIVLRDLPMLRDRLGLEPHVAVMKGLSNYLCLRRYHAFLGSPEAAQPRWARSLDLLAHFAEATDSGDGSELEGHLEDDFLWSEVSSSSDTRIGAACPHYEACFVTRMRETARRAQLVVVNHHLFFADLALRGPHPGGVLPPYDAVIFDEAHQLEDVATDFFGVRVSSTRIGSMLRDASRAFGDALRGPHGRTRSEAGGDGQVLAARAREASERFFAELTRAARLTEGRSPLAPELFESTSTVADRFHRLDAAIEAVARFAEANARTEEIELVQRRADELRSDLAAIAEGGGNQVRWADARARSASIGASPVDLASTLHARLFSRVPAVVLTSATLTTNRTFTFVRARLGLAGDDPPVRELEVPSPFDYRSHALIYLARDLPDPSSPAFLPRAAERVRALVEAAGGGAFVLCTSKRSMSAFFEALAHPERLVLVQGQAPKAALVERFRADEDAVLVATSSFWEGIDVPGRALRLVIVDRIPFAVPSDPLVLARSASLEASGENPFTGYQVPSAAITLKQGFGRLIRSAKDRGLVAILDSRIVTRGYGRALLASLPPARPTTDLTEALHFAEALARSGAEGPEASAPHEGVQAPLGTASLPR